MTLPDVQNHRAARPFKLTRVGVTGVVKPLHVTRGGKRNTLVGTFDVFVDLPAEQRGTHMSRNIEVVNRLIDEHVRKETASLEDLASGIAHALLERHEYAAEAEAHVRADYFREQRTPQTQAPSLERYDLFASSFVTREGKETRTVGVAVIGMTACPCAMEGSRAILSQQGHAVEGFPTITHNQRNVATLEVETGPGHAVEADHLIDIAEASLSAPTYELLKRGDETALVMQAHMNPRFVEDVVREMLHAFSRAFAHLPDETVVVARSEAEESIHKHNAYAERTALLGELRETNVPTFYALVDAMTGRESDVEAGLRAERRVLGLTRVKERNYDVLIKFEAAGFSLVDEFLQTNVRRIPGVSGVEIIMDWADYSEQLRDARDTLSQS